MIAIVDYGLGNLASVRNAFRAVGADVEVTSEPERIHQASGIVLPGVGAASAGMKLLRARGLDEVVQDIARADVPLLGICLGMQLLFERSEEGDAECLGLIRGTARLLRGGEKVPHIGWNQVATENRNRLWHKLPPNPYFYFVHSYVCDPADTSVSAGRTEYGEIFCSAVECGSVWGLQFHPERSGRTGLQLIGNFVERCATRSKSQN